MGEVLMFVIVELFGPWERKLFIGPKKKRPLYSINIGPVVALFWLFGN